MPSFRTEVFRGTSIQSWGVPYAFISAFTSPDGNTAIAEAFAFRHKEDGKFAAVDKVAASADLENPNLEMLITDEADAIDIVFDHVRNHCQLIVNEAWVGSYSPQIPSPDLQPHQFGYWRRAMIQIRQRGLSDEIIAEMEKFFSATEVRRFLFELPRAVKPVVIKRR